MRLSVLYLSDVYFPRVNGVSTSISVFRRELALQGADVRLVVPSYGGEEAEEGVVRVAGRRVPFDREDRFVPARRLAAAAAVGPVPDLVHVQTPFSAHRAGVSLSRRWQVPLVATWHTDFEHYLEHYLPFLPAPLARRIARGLARRTTRSVDHLVVPSTAIDAGLGELGIETPRSVVPTGLSPGELGTGDGARFRAAHGIGSDRPVALYVGRVAKEKNLEFLLESAVLVRREVPGFLLLIAGEGPARAALARRGRELGLADHLRFVGNLARPRGLADCYCAGDCFVFASRTETQGLVLLEAMSLGVPVVALAEQGTVDLLSRRRGALVPRAEAVDFATAMKRLLLDRGLRERIGEEGRRLASEWSARAQAARLGEIYRRLVVRRALQAALPPAASRQAFVHCDK